jgi:hypothetical protein
MYLVVSLLMLAVGWSVSKTVSQFMRLAVRLVGILVREYQTRKEGAAMITLKLSTVSKAEENQPATAPGMTPPSLCDTCVYARVLRGYEAGQEVITCGYAFPPFQVMFPVRECSDYEAKRKAQRCDHNGERLMVGSANLTTFQPTTPAGSQNAVRP